jgi:hypothetical protein
MIEMKNLKEELQAMGLDGNGRMDAQISVRDFEAWSGKKLANGQENEYGTVDYTVVIDEDGEDFIFTVEVANGFITHSYY